MGQPFLNSEQTLCLKKIMKYLIPLLAVCAISCVVHSFPAKYSGKDTKKLNELLAVMASVNEDEMANDESFDECVRCVSDRACLLCTADCIPRPRGRCFACVLGNCGHCVLPCTGVSSDNTILSYTNVSLCELSQKLLYVYVYYDTVNSL